MNRRYPALGTIAGLYQAAGVLVVGGAIIFAAISILGTLFARSSFISPIATILSVAVSTLAAMLTGVGLYAVGELLNLFRDMEFNSRMASYHAEAQAEYGRRTVALLDQLARRRQQRDLSNLPRPPQQPQTPQTQRPSPPTTGDVMRGMGTEG